MNYKLKILRGKKRKILVYSAIYNDFDNIKTPKIFDNSNDYILITDKIASDPVWSIRTIESSGVDPRLQAKEFKVLPHKFFPKFDYWIYIDGSFQLNISPSDCIEKLLNKKDIAAFKHPVRNCIFKEGEACIKGYKDDTDVIEKQLNKYRLNEYPAKNGLNACGVLIRKNNSKTKKFNEKWWHEIVHHSIRDQLSFNYCISQSKATLQTIDLNIWENEYFIHSKHNKQ